MAKIEINSDALKRLDKYREGLHESRQSIIEFMIEFYLDRSEEQ